MHHPLDVLGALGGLGLTVASATGEAAGAVLSATGVGAVAGVPAIAISTTGVVAGAGMMTAAIGDLASHAGGDDRVEPIKTNPETSSSAPPHEPKEVTGHRGHGYDQAMGRDGGRGVNDEAIQDAFNNPVKPVQVQPHPEGPSSNTRARTPLSWSTNKATSSPPTPVSIQGSG